MAKMREFLRLQGIEDIVFSLGSVPHEMFLNILGQSLAYIRTPITDGVCSSVLESLKLKVPVLAADNGTRPAGTELWKEGNLESLLSRMTDIAENRDSVVSRIPEIVLEDNAKKMASDIEVIYSRSSQADIIAG